MDIIQIYNEWIDFKQDINKRKRYLGYERYFSASSAGHCFKKQAFKRYNIDGTPIEERIKRLFRLGTILHSDFEQALKHHYLNNVESQNKYMLFIEREVISESLNVRGHLDFAYIDKDTGLCKIVDLKSAASYKWSKKFGRNRDKSPSFKYEMQIGTYATALQDAYSDLIVETELSLLWYKKDDSSMREEVIPANEFMIKATEYWDELNDIMKDNDLNNLDHLMPVKNGSGLKELPYHNQEDELIDKINEIPRDSYGVPFEGWECGKYCPWDSVCK
tara:strand:- start:71 stop:898 length:828 start_codon:yes stop_codon:yes gene_type:complete